MPFAPSVSLRSLRRNCLFFYLLTFPIRIQQIVQFYPGEALNDVAFVWHDGEAHLPARGNRADDHQLAHAPQYW